MASGTATFVCGPGMGQLAQLLTTQLHARGTVMSSTEERPYARAVLSCLFRCAMGGHIVLWLPEEGPVLGVHARRALERVVQGLAPAVLVEVEGAAYPSWLRAVGGALPVWPLEAGPSPASGATPSSKQPALSALEERLADIRPVNPGAGTGSWRPGGVLVIGDRPNARTWRAGAPFDLNVSWPFVSLLGSGCSSWLSEQLELAGVPETELYWVNAARAGGEPTCDLAALVTKLAPRLVVALGKNASTALESAKVAHEQVHHPQHWKRFHHGHRYRLVKVLAASKAPRA